VTRDRLRLLAAAALVACFAVMLWLASRDDAPEHAAQREPAPAVVASAREAPPAPVAIPAALTPNEQLQPAVPAEAPPIVLPPDTQRLAEEFVPGTTEWEEVPLMEDGTQVMRFLPAHYNVIAPAPIVLYLEVVDTATKKRVALGMPRARVRPFDRDDAWVEVPLVDDGTHRYVGTLAPTGGQQQLLLGRVVAEAIVQTPEAGTRRIPQALIYTKGPRAHLTGRWRDERKDGHLLLAAELVVDDPGLFTVMAQLVGPAREPIALTRGMAQLPRGTHWLPLRVWGKALRDAGVDGPYEVRNVLLRRDMNERGDYDPGPTILSAYRTHAYRAADFTDEAYVEPTVDRGEQIGPDHPSQAGNPAPLYPASARGLPGM
jgi:hypothetical protein